MEARISGVQISLLSDEAARRVSVTEIRTTGTKQGDPGGLTDPRMGVQERGRVCPHCFHPKCSGHFGHIELPCPIWRAWHLDKILHCYRVVCESCARPRFTLDEEPRILAMLRRVRPNTPLQRLSALAKLLKDRRTCPWPECRCPLPTYKVNQIFFLSRKWPAAALERLPPEARAIAQRDPTPQETRDLFDKISERTRQMWLQLDPRPLVHQVQLVPPPAIRPTIVTKRGSRGENDLTVLFRELLKACAVVRAEQKKLHDDPESEHQRRRWEVAQKELALRAAEILSPSATVKVVIPGSEALTGPRGSQRKTMSSTREGVRQRLDFKRGRLRQQGTGGRVDQCARSVIDPAPPSFDVHELGVPARIMDTLTYPEVASAFNLERLRELAKTPRVVAIRPPANALIATVAGFNLHGMTLEEREAFAMRIDIGWTVERHLQDGDFVMFNRQPTLHDPSWQAFKARRVACESFQMHQAVCPPFNADFDGDEMNLHVPQSEHERAECLELMAVPHLIRGTGTNAPLIGLIMGNRHLALALTTPGTLLTEAQVMQLVMQIEHTPGRTDEIRTSQRNPGGAVQVPEPALVKQRLWTGAQIASLVLPPTLTMTRGDVHIRRGQLCQGRLCGDTIGAKAHGLVDVITQDYGGWATIRFLSDLHRLLCEYGGMHGGASIGLIDCVPSSKVRTRTQDILRDSLQRVRHLEPLFEIDAQQAEILTTNALTRVQVDASTAVMANLSDERNDLARVIVSGAKGKAANAGQICALVGQQLIDGRRLPMRRRLGGDEADMALFDEHCSAHPGPLRTLPCLPANDASPLARGFISRSFVEGLNPVNMFFHLQASRMGIMYTSLSTAAVGYSYRKLMTAMLNHRVCIDGTVRDADGSLLQTIYGGDGRDPSKLEIVHLKPLAEQEWTGLALLEADENPEFVEEWRAEDRAERAAAAAKLHGVKHLLLPFSPARLVANSSEAAIPLVEVRARIAAAARQLALDDLQPGATARAALALAASPFCLGSPSLAVEVWEKAVAKFERAAIAPGEAVGAKAASASAAPLQQSTMNTFHYAGMAASDVTKGLPRLNELLDMQGTTGSALAHIVLRAPYCRSKRLVQRIAEVLPRLGLQEVVDRAVVVDAPELSEAEWLEAAVDADTERERGRFYMQKQGVRLSAEAQRRERIKEILSRRALEIFSEYGFLVKIAELIFRSELGKKVAEAELDESDDLEALNEELQRMCIQASREAPAAEEAEASAEAGEAPRTLQSLVASAQRTGTITPTPRKRARPSEDTLSEDGVASLPLDWRRASSEVEDPVLAMRRRIQGHSATLQKAGGDWVHQPCQVVVDLTLRRERLLDLGLEPHDIAEALRNFWRADAMVTSGSCFDATWVVRVRLIGAMALAVVVKKGIPLDSPEIRREVETICASRAKELMLQKVVVQGHRQVTRAEAVPDPAKPGTWMIHAIGMPIEDILLRMPEADARRCYTTDVPTTFGALGVEATRATLAKEMADIFREAHIDPRHVGVLADAMTLPGMPTAFTRHRLEELGRSVFSQAAFEQTTRILLNGAASAAVDPVMDANVCMIFGQPIVGMGTGAVHLLDDTSEDCDEPMEVVGPFRPEPLRRGGRLEDFERVAWEPWRNMRALAMLPRLAPMLDAFFRARSSVAELEARIFNMAPAWFAALETRLLNEGGWESSSHKGYKDVFYTLPGTSTEVRTTVEFDEPLQARGLVRREHIVKRRVCEPVDLQADSPTSSTLLGVRIKLAQELSISEESLPLIVDPTLVRIKRRRELRRGAWAVMLTRVWSGPTEVEAERQILARELPQLEVEIELVDPRRIPTVAAMWGLEEESADLDEAARAAVVTELREFLERVCLTQWIV